MKIGVFDSGVGGLSVANAIAQARPNDEIVFVNDVKNVPYGTKQILQIKGFVMPILQKLVEDGCVAIVIACNTVTTNLIEELRAELPVPLIGMEPMVKTAATQTKSGIIAVCATPGTLSSKRYAWLKQSFAKGVEVIEPDCSDWTSLIETNQISSSHVKQQIDSACDQGADVIVLGCTHYHWIQDIIDQEARGRAVVIQPEASIIKQLSKVIARL